MKNLIFHKETNFKLILTAYSVIDTLLVELKFQPSSYNTLSCRFSFISYLLPWWFWKVSWHQNSAFHWTDKKFIRRKGFLSSDYVQKGHLWTGTRENQLEEIGFQTFWLRRKLFLTIFVTNFKGKHLFFRLKLLLDYLRNSIDKRLCHLLSFLSILKQCITGIGF